MKGGLRVWVASSAGWEYLVGKGDRVYCSRRERLGSFETCAVMDVVEIGRNDGVDMSISERALALGCFRDIHFSPLHFFLYNTNIIS